MGVGWIVKNLDTSFSCKITDFPSSTRLELAAIVTALLAVPSDSQINIHTDSQAAIDGIDFCNNNDDIRALYKMANFTLILAIRSLTASKKLIVRYIKAKGHSGNKWNDRADELAKVAIHKVLINPLYILKFRIDNIGWNFNFLITWNNCIVETI